MYTATHRVLYAMYMSVFYLPSRKDKFQVRPYRVKNLSHHSSQYYEVPDQISFHNRVGE